MYPSMARASQSVTKRHKASQASPSKASQSVTCKASQSVTKRHKTSQSVTVTLQVTVHRARNHKTLPPIVP